MALIPASLVRTVGPGSQSFAEYRHVGTSPVEIWYTNHMASAASLSTVAFTVNRLYYSAFLSPRGGTLDRIGFDVTTVGGAGSKARVGIYKAISKTNVMPGALVVDSGEFDTTVTGPGASGVGLHAATISTKLDPDCLYYLTYLCGTAAPTVRGWAAGGMVGIGIGNTLNSVRCALVTTTFAYAGLPATAPAVDAFDNGVGPIIGVRYSA